MANIHVVLIPQDQGAIYNPYAKINIVSDRAGTVAITVNPVGAIEFPATAELTAPTYETVIEGLIKQAGLIEVTTTMDGISDTTQIEVIALVEVVTLGSDLDIASATFPKNVTINVWSNKPGTIDLVSNSANIVLGADQVTIVDVPVPVVVTLLAPLTGGLITGSRGLVTASIGVSVSLNIPILKIGPDQTVLRGDSDVNILLMVVCDIVGTVNLTSSDPLLEVPATVVIDSSYYAEVVAVGKGGCIGVVSAAMGALSDSCDITVSQSADASPVPTKGTSHNEIAATDNRNINRLTLPKLEDIDWSVDNWVRGMDIFVEQSPEVGGFKQVPVVWIGAERSFQSKVYKDLRDVSGSLNPPFITISRTSLSKDLDNKGQHWSNVPAIRDYMGGVFPVKTEIRHDKTAQFMNNAAKRRTGKSSYKFDDIPTETKPVYEITYVPIPVYITVEYKIYIWTAYRTQMNTVEHKFLTYVPSGNINRFVLNHDGHYFEGFLQEEVPEEGNLESLNKEERKLQATFTLSVLGHIAGDEKNMNSPVAPRRETAAETILDVEFGE